MLKESEPDREEAAKKMAAVCAAITIGREGIKNSNRIKNKGDNWILRIPNMRRWRYVIGENDPHATITNGVLDSSMDKLMMKSGRRSELGLKVCMLGCFCMR